MSRHDDAFMHWERARESVNRCDYLGARINYLKCVESFKQSESDKELKQATEEYEAFVKNDPVFNRLVSELLPIISANPGILQSEITKRFESMEWGELYCFDRPVAKEDIYYALYFADKFGMISRVKKGRSYELRIPSLNANNDNAKIPVLPEPDSLQKVEPLISDRKLPNELKSPRIAGFLNLVIPGAGYWYCGRKLRGFVVFLICSYLGAIFLALKSLPLFIIMLAILFADAVRFTKKHNTMLVGNIDVVSNYKDTIHNKTIFSLVVKALYIIVFFMFIGFVSLIYTGLKNDSLGKKNVAKNINSTNHSTEKSVKTEIKKPPQATAQEAAQNKETIKPAAKVEIPPLVQKIENPPKDTKTADMETLAQIEKRLAEYQAQLKKYYPDYPMRMTIQSDALILNGLEGAYSKSSEPDQKKFYSKIKVLKPKVEALQRVAYAMDVEKRSKDQGINADINAKGDRKQIFEYKFILMNSALAHQIANGGDVMANAKGLGFTKMVFTDGYNGTWSYNLD